MQSEQPDEHIKCFHQSLADCVTVVVTTSPVRSDPSLDMLQATFASFEMVGLGGCRCLLVCDYFGIGVRRSGEHSGLCPKPLIDNYQARIEAFKAAEWASHVHVLELKSWHGFALAVRRALDLVTTPLVCVVQHDLAFTRVLDLYPIVEVMQEHVGSVNFVSFLKINTQHYRAGLRSRMQLEVGEPVQWSHGSNFLNLTRLPQFLDSTHIANVSWYKDQYEKPLLHNATLSRGQFTEDNLGQYMIQQALLNPAVDGLASVGVLNVVDSFGCWLYDDGGPTMVFHLDGRKFISAEERAARGIPAKDFRYRFAAAACDGALAEMDMSEGKSATKERRDCGASQRELSEKA